MIVTHERAEAYALGDRTALVMAGTTSQTGEVGEVMDTPVTAAAARALGFDNLLPASRIAPRYLPVVRRPTPSPARHHGRTGRVDRDTDRTPHIANS
ncbi:hypothetical protein ACF06Q_32555 [Streptomyces leeuwenhoekii]|uniref:hypothetical protein n=1 Tax=Streptomyces leeuwenhoekii TaxID=1437453 RepID=UPI003702CC20